MSERIVSNNGITPPDWATVDWGKPNNQLAFELKVPLQVVSYYRMAVGKPRMLARNRVDWKSLDWRKSDQQLSQENALRVRDVRLAREVLGHPPVHSPEDDAYPCSGWGRGYRIVTKEMMDAVDWTINRDIDLARQWKVSRERVRQLRQEGGRPICKTGAYNPLSREVETWLIQNREKIEGKLAAEVADMCPVVLDRVRKFILMRKSGINFLWVQLRKGPALTLPINWQLPNKILQDVWNKSFNWAANSRMKYNFCEINPAWNLRDGATPAEESIKNNSELLAATRDEIKKAISVGVTPKWNVLSGYGIKQDDFPSSFPGKAEALGSSKQVGAG